MLAVRIDFLGGRLATGRRYEGASGNIAFLHLDGGTTKCVHFENSMIFMLMICGHIYTYIIVQ